MSETNPNRGAQTDAPELAELYAAGALTPAEQIELESRVQRGDAELASELARVRPVVQVLLDAGECDVPRHLREGIEARIATAAGEDAQGWAEVRGLRSVGARACGEPVGAGAAAGMYRAGELAILRHSEGRWTPSGIRGVRFRTLCADRKANRRTIVLQMDPGTELPDHDHAGLEEVYLVSGDLSIGAERLGPGDYFRVGAGAEHGTARTQDGCVCIIVSDYVPHTLATLPRYVWMVVKGMFGKAGGAGRSR